MSASQLSLFDVQNYEYNFLISPIYRVKKQVSEIKEKLHQEIGLDSRDLFPIAHISLLKFKYVDNDNLIIPHFKQALLNAKRFKIELNGVQSFDHQNEKRTVYLNISNPEPVKSVHKTLTQAFHLKGGNFFPHLTIARSVSEKQMARIKQLLSQFRDQFICNKIVVLKKPADSKLPYSKIYEAYLN